jgi:phosphoribosylanthranilate isomerase
VRLQSEGLFVQVSGLTSEEDALFAVALGANAVGFEVSRGERQIAVSAVADIVKRLPQGVVAVGIFHHELAQRIVEVANVVGLGAVQIDGPMTVEEIGYVSERVNTVVRSVPFDAERLSLAGGVDYLAVPDLDEPAALESSLDLLAQSSQRTPVIAAGGLDAASVLTVVQHYPVFGVAVRAGVEREVGVVDPAALGEFVANARWAYAHSAVERHFDEWTL